MRRFLIEARYTLTLPDETDHHELGTALAALMVQYVEDRGGTLGGGVKTWEVDQYGLTQLARHP